MLKNSSTLVTSKDNFLNKCCLIFSFAFIIVLFLFNIKNGFFWDAVQLGSRHAHFYLSTNFSDLILPNEIDSGHIPTFGFVLALIWKFTEKSLIVSHLLIFPFILGILWQLSLLLRKFVPEKHFGVALILVLLNSTLLSQFIIVSPDVPLTFFFLWGINCVHDNKKRTLSFVVFFLFLISMRGMMISFCLLLWDIYKNIKFTRNYNNDIINLLKRSLIYLPGLLIFIAFSTYHYNKVGWIGFHKDSPWASSFEKTDLMGFLKNILVLVYRQIEFGRFGIWLVLIFLTFKNRNIILENKKSKSIILLALIFILILPINMIWAKSLLNPRYLLPSYICASILCTYLLFNFSLNKYLRFFFILIWLVSFSTAGFNIFPRVKSQGWDSTLAHIPYFKLRDDTINYLNKKNIDLKDVGTFFPNIATLEIVDLNNDNRTFARYDGNNKYILTSNIYNISNADLSEISKSYVLIKHSKKLGIYIDIYQRIN